MTETRIRKSESSPNDELRNAPAEKRVATAISIFSSSLHCVREAGTFAPMEVTLPKPLDERLSPKDAALHLAIGLFVTEEATLSQAAQTAGLSQAEFLRELGQRHIPIHYGEEELHADLESIESLVAR